MVGLLPNTDINRKILGGSQTIPRFRSRYSRFVVLMRYALPVVAGVVFLLLVIWPDLTPKPDRFALGISDLNVEIDGGQRVVNARFTGVDSENRPIVRRLPITDAAVARGMAHFGESGRFLTLLEALIYSMTKGTNFELRTRVLIFVMALLQATSPSRGRAIRTISAEGFRITDSGGRIFSAGSRH